MIGIITPYTHNTQHTHDALNLNKSLSYKVLVCLI